MKRKGEIIDPDAFDIMYVADNGFNLISALTGEAHIRCICHCINWVVKQSVEECPTIGLLVSECRELVSHFKRCELQHKLASTSKNRKEGKYLDNIDCFVIKDIIDLLSTFKIVSKKLSAADVPTLHSALP